MTHLLLGAAVALISATAGADEKQQCLSSYVDAQTLRNQKKLTDAHRALLSCARDACPKEISADCTTWLREVDASFPTVVFDARDADGRDRLDVRVTLDGQPFLEQIDGHAKNIDPGVHVFRYEAAGALPVEDRVAIREGEKNRRLSVVLKKTISTQLPPAPPPPPSRPIPTLAIVFGGLTLAGAGVFAGFGLAGRYGDPSLRTLDACKGHCSNDDVSSVKLKFAVADVGLVTGVVSLALATYFFVTRPTASAPARKTSALEDVLRSVTVTGVR
ncbi:Hypothetical protein A7982_03277 [Minicystis rosea]|nr:Hypothetical protein A7982_03277 [Minicystis rosea]